MGLKSLLIFLVLTMGIVGVFGFFSFGLIDYSGYHMCPVSAMLGGDCPPLGNSLILAIHHISGLQQLSRFIIDIDLGSLMAFVVLLIFASWIFLKLTWQSLVGRHALYFRNDAAGELRLVSVGKFLRWLSLRNKRHPHAVFWGARYLPRMQFIVVRGLSIF